MDLVILIHGIAFGPRVDGIRDEFGDYPLERDGMLLNVSHLEVVVGQVLIEHTLDAISDVCVIGC